MSDDDGTCAHRALIVGSRGRRDATVEVEVGHSGAKATWDDVGEDDG